MALLGPGSCRQEGLRKSRLQEANARGSFKRFIQGVYSSVLFEEAYYPGSTTFRAVLLNRLLKLDESESIFLAEESWQDLMELPVTNGILEEEFGADSCIAVSDHEFAFRLKDPDAWLFLTDRYAKEKPLAEKADAWRSVATRSVHIDDRDLFYAINECLSISLSQELFCESCPVPGGVHHVSERIDRLVGLLPSYIPKGESILEICCGSGMATQALFRLGHSPIVMDSDRCDICLALKSGLLEPQKSFVLDARLLPDLLPERSFDAVVGFMVGLIEDFNWPLWQEILEKASLLARKRLLFTVYTQKEAELIAREFEGAGWSCKVIDNRDPSGIYDQWACSATMAD